MSPLICLSTAFQSTLALIVWSPPHCNTTSSTHKLLDVFPGLKGDSAFNANFYQSCYRRFNETLGVMHLILTTLLFTKERRQRPLLNRCFTIEVHFWVPYPFPSFTLIASNICTVVGPYQSFHFPPSIANWHPGLWQWSQWTQLAVWCALLSSINVCILITKCPHMPQGLLRLQV